MRAAEAVEKSRPTDRPTLASPVGASARIGAVLFDLDGTLYRQRPLRVRMALDLAMATVLDPAGAPDRWRALRAFRQAQETLRAHGGPVSARAQVEMAARQSGVPFARVEALVNEWMFDRPLKHLAGCRAAGVVQLIDHLRAVGIPVGVLSDYAAESKLAALGLGGRFAPVLCATDPGIGAFKPSPRGFLAACRTWQLEPSQVLFVGDRVDVDAVGAAAAGMPCVIIASSPPRELPAGTLVLPSLERLRRVLADRG